ncbi:MAG: hypothetical protein JSV84_13545 [Gemmatimonadota bacterium]|nr:MAG: hypothetical protein JSV84_13545 [Gemmatimonadota bacterium]
MRREIPIAITFIFGIFMILQYFVQHPVVSFLASRFQRWAIIVLSFAYVLGVSNILRVNGSKILRREKDWGYKLVLVLALLATLVIGLVQGLSKGTFFIDRIYMKMYMPMMATMYASLAFFIASAAFRSFRIRTWQTGFLAVTALIVMVGRIPLVYNFVWTRYPDLVEWIMNVPNVVAYRAILIGAALGAIATGLRVIFGIERSYLGGE